MSRWPTNRRSKIWSKLRRRTKQNTKWHVNELISNMEVADAVHPIPDRTHSRSAAVDSARAARARTRGISGGPSQRDAGRRPGQAEEPGHDREGLLGGACEE